MNDRLLLRYRQMYLCGIDLRTDQVRSFLRPSGQPAKSSQAMGKLMRCTLGKLGHEFPTVPAASTEARKQGEVGTKSVKDFWPNR